MKLPISLQYRPVGTQNAPFVMQNSPLLRTVASIKTDLIPQRKRAYYAKQDQTTWAEPHRNNGGADGCRYYCRRWRTRAKFDH